jgi:hypothetical protein
MILRRLLERLDTEIDLPRIEVCFGPNRHSSAVHIPSITHTYSYFFFKPVNAIELTLSFRSTSRGNRGGHLSQETDNMAEAQASTIQAQGALLKTQAKTKVRISLLLLE